MIKKFVSKTLLSMVMNKPAREKFEAVQEAKRAQKTALKTAAPVPTPPAPTAGETANLVREALDTAEKELVAKKARRPMTGGRQALIDEAMLIRRSKAKVLDELDPKQREKLMIMALKSLVGDAER